MEVIARRTLLSAPVSLFSASKWEPLFNAVDFSGWKHFGHGTWKIEDSALVGLCDHGKPGPGYLFTERQFVDFRLELPKEARSLRWSKTRQ